MHIFRIHGVLAEVAGSRLLAQHLQPYETVKEKGHGTLEVLRVRLFNILYECLVDFRIRMKLELSGSHVGNYELLEMKVIKSSTRH